MPADVLVVIDPKWRGSGSSRSRQSSARELGHGRREVLHRFDRLTDELGLDRERAGGWCVLQTVAWAIGSDHLARHIETARWLLGAGR
jgi:streptomycin 6-kinase